MNKEDIVYRIDQKLGELWPDRAALEVLNSPEIEVNPNLRAFYLYEKGLFEAVKSMFTEGTTEGDLIIKNGENRQKIVERLSNE